MTLFFKLHENGRKFLKKIEKIVEKEQFLLFPLFQKDLFCRQVKTRSYLGKG